MNFRKALVDDGEQLNVLFNKLYQYETKYDNNNSKDFSLDDYFSKFKIEFPSTIIIVCEIDEKIVGYIHGFLLASKHHINKQYNIGTIYVLDEYRRQGIATGLINAFIDEVKVREGKFISITNYSDNKEAAALYSKFGFEVLKEDRRKEL